MKWKIHTKNCTQKWVCFGTKARQTTRWWLKTRKQQHTSQTVCVRNRTGWEATTKNLTNRKKESSSSPPQNSHTRRHTHRERPATFQFHHRPRIVYCACKCTAAAASTQIRITPSDSTIKQKAKWISKKLTPRTFISYGRCVYARRYQCVFPFFVYAAIRLGKHNKSKGTQYQTVDVICRVQMLTQQITHKLTHLFRCSDESHNWNTKVGKFSADFGMAKLFRHQPNESNIKMSCLWKTLYFLIWEYQKKFFCFQNCCF